MEDRKLKTPDDCLRCELCVQAAPELFQLDENGKSKVVRQPKNEHEWSIAEEAAMSCPVEGISFGDSE